MKITGYIMYSLDVFDREEVKIPGTTEIEFMLYDENARDVTHVKDVLPPTVQYEDSIYAKLRPRNRVSMICNQNYDEDDSNYDYYKLYKFFTVEEIEIIE